MNFYIIEYFLWVSCWGIVFNKLGRVFVFGGGSRGGGGWEVYVLVGVIDNL